MTTTQQRLDERYGRHRSPLTRWVVGGVVALAVIGGGVFAWQTVTAQLNAVDADATAFEVLDDHSVTLGFQITAPAGRSVACALEAQDEQHGVVGWRIVEYPPSDASARAFREVIPTTATATTGLVNACWVT